MSWVFGVAVFFLIWWLVLFATLPFGVRTQDDEEDVTLGTVASAPGGPHMGKTVVRTTLIAFAVFALFYFFTAVLEFGFEDIPRVVPDF
jgi:predicted secreted protein